MTKMRLLLRSIFRSLMQLPAQHPLLSLIFAYNQESEKPRISPQTVRILPLLPYDIVCRRLTPYFTGVEPNADNIVWL